jgi:hypothetical protein
VIVFPDEGEVWLLQRMLKQPNPLTDPFRLRLFTNNYTPVKDSVLADFVQPAVSGYGTIDLPPSGWTDAQSSAGIAQSVWSAGFLGFTVSSGSASIYGYFVADPDSNFCLWAERFLTAPLPLAVLTPVFVLPVVRMLSQFQP